MANNGAATCRGPAIVGHEGFLNLEDIYNLNLPVDLVVLSACETGLGKAIRGEGLLGLTPGSMHAGTAGTYSLQFTAGADPASHAVNFGVQ